MKLPNGYGSVSKQSGKRRKPWIARITNAWQYDEIENKFIQKRMTIGTYATREEALNALAEYNLDPYDLSTHTITVRGLYDRWSGEYFKTLKSETSVRSVKSAWRYCSSIYDMRVRDLKAHHIKDLITNAYAYKLNGPSKGQRIEASGRTKERIKSLFNLMLDYAVEYELATTNVARTFDLSSDIVEDVAKMKRSHIIFTDSELKLLWDNLDRVKYIDWILIQCYMGWRPQELVKLRLEDVNIEDWHITGGMKTKAGKRRVVPVHSKIKPLVQRNYDKAVALGSDYLLNDPTSRSGSTMTYDKYKYRFDSVVIDMLRLDPNHRPHDPRTTFVTMAKKAGVDEYAIKLMVGHSIQDITEGTYTKRDIEWLRIDLEKIR